MGLTDRQRIVLDAISRLTEANGYPPNYRELMNELGIRSPNGIAGHVAALVKKGVLVHEKKTARSLRLASPTAGVWRSLREHKPAIGQLILVEAMPISSDIYEPYAGKWNGTALVTSGPELWSKTIYGQFIRAWKPI